MDSLAPGIVRFAESFLLSPDDVQVLVLCVEQRDRWHDAGEIERTLRIPPAARACLDHFARRNLLDIRITGDLRYRFRPGTSELEAQAVAFVDAYRRNQAQALESIGR